MKKFVKQMIENAEEVLKEENMTHLTVKPWGSEVLLSESEEEGWLCKRLTVNPNSRMSLQSHAKRLESWLVVKGTGIVTIEGYNTMLYPGDTVKISVGEQHRLANPNLEGELVVLEMQYGECDPEDIERYHDDYGRTDLLEPGDNVVFIRYHDEESQPIESFSEPGDEGVVVVVEHSEDDDEEPMYWVHSDKGTASFFREELKRIHV